MSFSYNSNRAFHTASKRFSVDGRRFGSTSLKGTTEGIQDLCAVDVKLQALKKKLDKMDEYYKFQETASSLRRVMLEVVESSWYTNFMMVIILVNTLILFFGTIRFINRQYRFYFEILDALMMALYVVEAGLKMYVYRMACLKRTSDLLDFGIVLVSLIEMIIPVVTGPVSSQLEGSTQIFKIIRVLRALRSIRMFKAIRFFENIQVIIKTCLSSFKSLGYITMLLAIFMVIFYVIGRQWFRDSCKEHFGSPDDTIFTLVQLLTLDDWYDILAAEDDYKNGKFPFLLFIYLFIYIFLQYFIILNLLVAVFVDNFQHSLREKNIKKASERHAKEKQKKSDESSDDEYSDDSEAETVDFEKIRDKILRKDQERVQQMDDVDAFDAEADLEKFMDKASESEINLTKAHYTILPALERHCHRYFDYMACHDRIIDAVVDSADDTIGARLT